MSSTSDTIKELELEIERYENDAFILRKNGESDWVCRREIMKLRTQIRRLSSKV